MAENEDDQVPFAERLFKARELRGMSQSELSKRTGIQPSSLSHFEAGTRKPGFDNLRRIANALSVSTDFLLARVDSPDMTGAADPLNRDNRLQNANDRDLANAFIQLLADRSKNEP